MESNHHPRINSTLLDLPATSEKRLMKISHKVSGNLKRSFESKNNN